MRRIIGFCLVIWLVCLVVAPAAAGISPDFTFSDELLSLAEQYVPTVGQLAGGELLVQYFE